MRKSISSLVLLLAFSSISEAKVIHVTTDYPTIQEGIDAASDGDTVLVDPGTYFENIDFRGKAIVVKSTSEYTQTTIDGSQSGTVVKFISNEDSRSVLEGFKITNGSAVGGAGILVYSSPTIKHNWIVNNTASGGGGGIGVNPVLFVPFPTITGNIIEDNTANIGGGIVAGSSLKGPAVPYVTHNIIRGNTASFRGGAIAFANTWSSNSRRPTIFNNLIVDNSSGIYIANSQTAPSADVSIGNNTIVENSGPGIYAILAAPVISDCIIWDNNDDLKFTVVATSTIVQYCCMQDGDYEGTNGNISDDPLFVAGPQGQYYLSHASAGQAQQSSCVDSGSGSAISIGLQGMTTRTDGIPDQGQVDIGYHFSLDLVTGVADEVVAGVPTIFMLSQNYPNPFNPETTIKYQLPKASQIRLEVFNLLGQRVATLVDKEQLTGFYTVQWNGKDDLGRQVASGVYLYKLQAAGFVKVRKLTLLR